MQMVLDGKFREKNMYHNYTLQLFWLNDSLQANGKSDVSPSDAVSLNPTQNQLSGETNDRTTSQSVSFGFVTRLDFTRAFLSQDSQKHSGTIPGALLVGSRLYGAIVTIIVTIPLVTPRPERFLGVSAMVRENQADPAQQCNYWRAAISRLACNESFGPGQTTPLHAKCEIAARQTPHCTPNERLQRSWTVYRAGWADIAASRRSHREIRR